MDTLTHAITGAAIGCACGAGASPAQQLMLAGLGVVASLLPDLDGCCGCVSPRAAWRYHRVALHGVPSALVAGIVLEAIALCTPVARVGFATITWVILAGVLSHLALDVLTSFGTALAYPFSRRRFTLRTLFIVDPILLAILTIGVWQQRPGLALAAATAYIALSGLMRTWVAMRVRRSLHEWGSPAAQFTVEPRLWAPWRWLVIARHPTGYRVAYATPLGIGPWFTTPPAAKLGEHLAADPLLSAFLEICEFPHYSNFIAADGTRGVFIEDAKWWLALPRRPLAFAVLIDDTGAATRVRQTRLWDRGPLGTIAPSPLCSPTSATAS